MSREDLHFRLRIPEGLKRQIEATAKANNRSMTAEIIDRLSGSSSETLRDKFAGQALAGMMASDADGTHYGPAAAAERAYKLADAMLEVREGA